MDRILSIEELLKELDKYDLRELHLHHTWKPNHADFNGHNHIQLQQGMRNYHVNVKKWDDIAQHLTVMPDGQIVTGRQLGVMPCSIYGQNSKHVLMIELLGNFDIGHDTLDGPQKENIMQLTQYCLDRNMEILFHNEYSSKSCPGTSIDKEQFLLEAKEYNKDNVPKWQKDALNELVEKNIIDSPEYWLPKLGKQITAGEVMAIINKIVE